VAEAYAQLKGGKPSLAAGERVLDKLDSLGVNIEEAHPALEEYEAITRCDYERGAKGSEEYKKDRQTAWTTFHEALKHTEGPEEEGGVTMLKLVRKGGLRKASALRARRTFAVNTRAG
jgi:hypothetical protein